MRALKKILIGLFIAVILFAVTGFFAVPPLLRSVLVKELSARFHRQVSISKITLNPFTLSAKITGFAVRERGIDATFFSFEELNCDLSFKSLLKMIPDVRQIIIRKPYLRIDRLDEKTYNFSDILKQEESKGDAKNAQGKTKPFRFTIQALHIVDGAIDFVDRPKKTKHALTELNLSVPIISNLPRDINTFVQPSLSVKINGTPYAVSGETKPFSDSLETTLKIDIRRIDVPYYLAYIPIELPFKLLSSFLDVSGTIAFVQYKDRSPDLTFRGDVSLSECALQDRRKNTILQFPRLSIAIASIEPLVQKVHLSQVSLESPQILIERSESGELAESFIPAPKEASSRSAPKKPAGGVSEKGPFSLTVDNVQVSKGTVSFRDRALRGSPVMTMGNLEVQATAISLTERAKSTLSLSCLLNRKGSVAANGTFSLKPLSGDLKLSLKNIELHPFEPYFTDRIKIAVANGSAALDGKLSAGSTDSKGLRTVFQGSLSLNRFASVDKASGEDFLKWDSLFFNNVNLRTNPTAIAIDGISLSGFYARVALSPEGKLNLVEAFKGEATKEDTGAASQEKTEGKQESPRAEAEQATPIKVNTITLQGGTIDFKDEWIRHHYSTRLEELGGRVSGLSSQADTLATVDLRASLEGHAPLEITGRINPLRKDLFVDLKARFKDMELSPVTPYSGKYIGYAIEKGKLSFDLQYLIDKRKLDSQNTIFIDQLTLGQAVESPDATKLPVRLAIALLKDRNGEIRLDIPVTGSIDDPQFSVWRIILKIIGNLLVKAATSPFALLGALFGGGEELGYIEFDYGSSALTPESGKKMQVLTKALQDRPSLRVDIEGFVDVENDKEALRRQIFLGKMKAQKLKDLLKGGATGVSLNDVKIEPQEYEKYLRLAYKAERFPKPRNIIGLEKTLPVPEMEKLMFTNIEAKDDDLRLLAAQRAAQTKDKLLEGGLIEAARLFIVEPKSLAPSRAEGKEKYKESRVEFRLK